MENYLKLEYIAILNRLVSAFLDIAKGNAMRERTMTINYGIKVLNGFIKIYGKYLLFDDKKSFTLADT